MRTTDPPAVARPPGIRLLVADDDDGVRALFATLLAAAKGVTSVIEAEDGAAAVELGRGQRFDVAVLDLNMPRLDGIAAAQQLRALQPSLRIALQSSDPELLRERGGGLGLPLFDKVDFDQLVAWVERQASNAAGHNGSGRLAPLARKLDLCCSSCGYGIVSRDPPDRCPLCGSGADWTDAPRRNARRAALHEQAAG